MGGVESGLRAGCCQCEGAPGSDVVRLEEVPARPPRGAHACELQLRGPGLSAAKEDESPPTVQGILDHADRNHLIKLAALLPQGPVTVSKKPPLQNQSHFARKASYCTKDTVQNVRNIKKTMDDHEAEFRSIGKNLRELSSDEGAYQARVKNRADLRSAATEKEFEGRRRQLSLARERVAQQLKVHRSILVEEEMKTMQGRDPDVASCRGLAPAVFRAKKRGNSVSPERAAGGNGSGAMSRCR